MEEEEKYFSVFLFLYSFSCPFFSSEASRELMSDNTSLLVPFPVSWEFMNFSFSPVGEFSLDFLLLDSSPDNEPSLGLFLCFLFSSFLGFDSWLKTSPMSNPTVSFSLCNSSSSGSFKSWCSPNVSIILPPSKLNPPYTLIRPSLISFLQWFLLNKS